MADETVMMLSWDERGTLVPFFSVDELDRLLDGMHGETTRDDLPLVVTVLDGDDPGGPALSIGCGGSLSVAVWRTPDDTAALLSRGGHADRGPREFSFCGEHMKYPASALIENELARAAVHAFVRSRSRPGNLTWQTP